MYSFINLIDLINRDEEVILVKNYFIYFFRGC